ncbi:MAG: radical SAM protein [Thermodesulfobacteria bacterium]|nr:radical SAM protein [Thermodesulfobacteriota bacterium]
MSELRPFDSCGIMLSYRCQCGCRHCVYACGPRWKEWMDREQLEDLLLGISRTWENPRGLHLAGGEAFLNFDLLLFGVEKCRRLGLPIEYVETNAGWCVNEEVGREKFRLLKEAGLSSVLISVSPFHAETIPLKRTLTAIRLAEEIFGPANVIVYMSQFIELIARFDVERPVPLSRWIEAYGPEGAGRLFWQGYALIPGGRAGIELGDLAPQRHPAEAFKGHHCRREILLSRHCHFDPYENYIPLFCGGLSLGKIDRDLPGFVVRFRSEDLPLVNILVREGPYGLGRFAAENFGFRPNPRGYAGKCHLCVEVRRFLNEKGEFPELTPRAFYENLRSHLPPLKMGGGHAP